MNFDQESAQSFATAVSELQVSRLMLQAIQDHQLGHLSKAQSAYQQILLVDKHNLAALNNLSLLKDAASALTLLQLALEIDPNYVDALINIATRWLEIGNLDLAQSFLQRAHVLSAEDNRILGLIQRIESSRIPQNQSSLVMQNNSLSATPFFSIIIPTHRRAHLLDRALQSITSQTLSSASEIIVISDCPDEATDAICQKWLKPKDAYLRRSGKPGPSESRNIGLKMAKGDVILFLDDDDAWHPNLLASLQNCEALRIGQPVYFNCSIVKETRQTTHTQKHSEVFLDTHGLLTLDVFVKNKVHMSCIACPRSLLNGITFDPHMRAYEDWDFLLFLYERKFPVHVSILGSQIHEVDDATTDRRGSSQAATDMNAVIDYLYVYRRHPVSPDLQQKRASLLASVGLTLPAELL